MSQRSFFLFSLLILRKIWSIPVDHPKIKIRESLFSGEKGGSPACLGAFRKTCFWIRQQLLQMKEKEYRYGNIRVLVSIISKIPVFESLIMILCRRQWPEVESDIGCRFQVGHINDLTAGIVI